MNHKEAVQGLRELADWLEEHGEAIEAAGEGDLTVEVKDYLSNDKKGLAAYLALPGGWEKDYGTPGVFYLTRPFGAVEFKVVAWRSAVCEKVPTGKKVTRKVPTAWEDVVEDEYTWDCKPILEAVAE